MKQRRNFVKKGNWTLFSGSSIKGIGSTTGLFAISLALMIFTAVCISSCGQNKAAESIPALDTGFSSPEETTSETWIIEDTIPSLAGHPAPSKETVCEATEPEETLPTVPQETIPEETVAPVQSSRKRYEGDDFPQYFQNDYPDNRYGSGTIASNGCGIVSLAMVATYLTGYEYLPDELAHWFGSLAENNIARMVIGAETLGLPIERVDNIDKATEAFREGKIGIMMLDRKEGKTYFTSSQHFVIIRGMTEDGKYLVIDPNRDNYDHWALKEGFEKGFKRQMLVNPYSGCWVIDPKAIPENFVPYDKVEYPRQDNYPGIELTPEEEKIIVQLIWAEARGESLEGQQAVAEVILNRLESGKFGESINGIVYGPGQFRGIPAMEKAKPWQAQYDALDEARYGRQVLKKDVFYFSTEYPTRFLYKRIGGHYFYGGPGYEPVPRSTTPATEPTEESIPVPTTEPMPVLTPEPVPLSPA